MARTLSLGALAVAAVLAVAHGVDAFLLGDGSGQSGAAGTAARWVAAALPALALALRVASERQGRLPWLLLACALVLWSAAHALFAALSDGGASGASVADALWLAAYVPAAAAVIVLCRSVARRRSVAAVLDAALAGICTLALAAAIVLERVLDAADGLDTLTLAVSAAYPILDALLLALVLGGLAFAGWRADLRFGLLGVGVLLFVAGDSLYLTTSADGTYLEGGIVEACWMWSAIALGLAAWQPAPPAEAEAALRASLRTALMPVLLGTFALALLLEEALTDSSLVTLVPGAAAIAASLARLGNTAIVQRALVLRLRHEARTDALTGLGNRILLRRRLAEAFEPDAAPAALVLIDLDGFRNYNDTFGQEAGDVLLQRIATSLVLAGGASVQAFRSGGDEFHLLLPDGESPERRAAEVARAVEQRGDGFVVSASWGVVRLPAEATDADAALALASHRAHRRKAETRGDLGVRNGELLHAMLEERSPETAGHAVAVSEIAVEVASRMGLDEHQCQVVRQTALLHDVGKLGLPVEVLGKRGPLDEEEWRLVRTHTLIGERVLATAPGLEDVAAAVRASHERWDGSGYPDRLQGDAIPLPARIVFVCDAFDAMVSDRPYRAARGEEAALGELRACAGSQFDPSVVAAFADVLATRGSQQRAGHRLPS